MNPFQNNYGVSGAYQNLLGSWRNEFGSRMFIENIGLDGTIWGIFRTNSGSPSPYESFAMTGKILNQKISFQVEFLGYQTITNWAGELFQEPGKVIIATDWSMVFLNKTIFQKEIKQEILNGSNRFYKII